MLKVPKKHNIKKKKIIGNFFDKVFLPLQFTTIRIIYQTTTSFL